MTDEDAVFLSSIYRARYSSDAGLLPLGEPIEQDAERALIIAREMARWMNRLKADKSYDNSRFFFGDALVPCEALFSANIMAVLCENQCQRFFLDFGSHSSRHNSSAFLAERNPNCLSGFL